MSRDGSEDTLDVLDFVTIQVAVRAHERERKSTLKLPWRVQLFATESRTS